ncbi:sulfate/molybdate ABC transporter ATP-binding protein [Gloeobacter kilaueensis]|uniref:ABC-type quaternary amine transporter n=1 Tax=Gloeobacter kilaueensis (strain ATCC BAA-2537 / CCAP 1431/1 / ULC 316 / JS1) TaxID=1183438 RepID=U5QBQ6_GLOK1|nr:sulfate ABC transporter ATP-binding protein [Gloeobacter kilaueensis]AGY56291.1 sulfate ABC transporter ATPase subunit [Gloeobacter kilaueensis JS1]
MGISVRGVTKQFGSFVALDNVSLDVNSGSLVALLGPSGSGKTTLLRVIAGLEEPDTGTVYFDETDTTRVPIRQRNVGFVFQHYALFKHMTIRENIGFGLSIRKRPKAEINERVNELLKLIQLEGLAGRYPAQLSGGQRQRVALARALAAEPQVLLLDEPFGALDAKVRKELRDWLRRLHDQMHVTSIFVTHDQEEAMEVADQIVVVNKGRIEQVGSAQEIYNTPATPFVMSFVGPVNVLKPNNPLVKHLPPQHTSEKGEVFIRPHDVVILPHQESDSLPAEVNRITHLGWDIVIDLSLDSENAVAVHLTREDFRQLEGQLGELEVGQQVNIRPREARAFAQSVI